MKLSTCLTRPESMGEEFSFTRVISMVVIIGALIMSGFVLWKANDVLEGAKSAGILFGTIAGPAMIFLFKQKQNEVKAELGRLQNQAIGVN